MIVNIYQVLPMMGIILEVCKTQMKTYKYIAGIGSYIFGFPMLKNRRWTHNEISTCFFLLAFLFWTRSWFSMYRNWSMTTSVSLCKEWPFF